MPNDKSILGFSTKSYIFQNFNFFATYQLTLITTYESEYMNLTLGALCLFLVSLAIVFQRYMTDEFHSEKTGHA